MTPEEKKAYQLGYSRGYNAGRAGKWPAHRPPSPPDEAVRKLMAALTGLRDAVDSYLATSDPDDPELEAWFGWHIDATDEAMRVITLWLFER